MKLSSKSIGVRAVDINKCLQNIEVSTPHIYFETIDPVGAGIRLAANIQGLEIIEYNQLKVIANNLGIRPSEINNTLQILTDLDYVNVIKDVKTNKITKKKVEGTKKKAIAKLEDLKTVYGEVREKVMAARKQAGMD